MFDDLMKELKETYAGKDYEYGYGSWSHIAQRVCKELKDRYNKDFDYHTPSREQYIAITYKGWCILRVYIKKQRGDIRYSGFWTSSYKWYIKDIFIVEVRNFNDVNSLEEEMNGIDKYEDNEKKKIEDENKRVIEAVNVLKEHFNVDTQGVKEIIRSLDLRYYVLENLLGEEEV